MKKSNSISMVAIIAIAIFALVACSKNSKIDPIWGTQPVDTTFAAGFPLDKFHKLGIEGDTANQKKLFELYRKTLTKNVMQNYPCIKSAENVRFVFGSGEVEKVVSGDGNTYGGKFSNEILIILNDSCIKDTLFLACGNGMLSPISWKDGSSSDWGTAETCRFTILPGEGLASHLPELQAWSDAAGTLDIPIKDVSGKIVKSETYTQYLGKYESVLFPGDVIDMCQEKVFNAAGQEVQFETRIAESKKANAKAKKH